jgi:hypothetical protein
MPSLVNWGEDAGFRVYRNPLERVQRGFQELEIVNRAERALIQRAHVADGDVVAPALGARAALAASIRPALERITLVMPAEQVLSCIKVGAVREAHT